MTTFKTDEDALDHALTIAGRLNEKFNTDNWKAETWENLGWHGSASCGDYPNKIEVIGEQGSFHAYYKAYSTVVGNGESPELAVINLKDRRVKAMLFAAEVYGEFMASYKMGTEK